MTKAIYDKTREDGGEDVVLARDLLNDVPHTPNMNTESVGRILDSGWAFRDGDAMVMVVPQPDRKHVELVWWLPMPLWLNVQGMNALLAMCRAVLLEYGPAANDWTVSGTFDAPGDTPEKMQARSREITKIHLQWIPSMKMEEVPHTNYWRGTSTVGEIITAANSWKAQL